MNKNIKKFVVDSEFIGETLKNKLSLEEFLLLMYFDNSYDNVFDLKVIEASLNIDPNIILSAYSGLLKKKLIKCDAVKNEDGKIIEKVSLDNFYYNLVSSEKKETKKCELQDIYNKFESGFGRPLTTLDKEIIHAWIEKGFTEELILAALNEAVYNDLLSLRHVDKILYEWNRKGIKEVKDIKEGYMKENTNEYTFEPSLLDFDWLDEK